MLDSIAAPETDETAPSAAVATAPTPRGRPRPAGRAARKAGATADRSVPQQGFAGVIFDIDGVVLDTPHEAAWRAALNGLADPELFTAALYRNAVAGRPRLDGARAALEALGVPAADSLAPVYARRKQAVLERMLRDQPVLAFPDAMDLIAHLARSGVPMAAASASRNAGRLLDAVSLAGAPLRRYFAADLCGYEVSRGKPDPELFLAAATALHADPGRCLVVEDAPNGVLAAKRAGCAALGVARDGDKRSLAEAGADLVVASLDALNRSGLARGGLIPVKP